MAIDNDEGFVLDCESVCLLGKKLILSGAQFESGLAFFLHAEGEALDAISDAIPTAAQATFADLESYNSATRDLICCLAEIETAVNTKIASGLTLLDATDPCACTP